MRCCIDLGPVRPPKRAQGAEGHRRAPRSSCLLPPRGPAMPRGGTVSKCHIGGSGRRQPRHRPRAEEGLQGRDAREGAKGAGWCPVSCPVVTCGHACRQVASAIDRNVKEIATTCYDRALSLVRDNMAAMDAAVEKLVEVETLTGDEFRAIVEQYTTIPLENQEAVERQRLGVLEAEKRQQQTAAAVMAAFETLDKQ